MPSRILLALLSLGVISVVSRFRTAIPATLEQATQFTPSSLLQTFWGEGTQTWSQLMEFRLQRPGLWQEPWLALCLAAHTMLLLYLLRKS